MILFDIIESSNQQQLMRNYIMKFTPNEIVNHLLHNTETRYVMCLVSRISYEDARASIDENPDAVKVVYNSRYLSMHEGSNKTKYETSDGFYEYVIPVDDMGDELPESYFFK